MGNKFAFKVIVILSVLLGNNSVFGQSNSATKELEEKVAALEKKVEYLELIQEIDKLHTSMVSESNGISITSLELKYDIFGKSLNEEVLSMTEILYLASEANFNSTKSHLESVEYLLSLKLLTSKFSETEIQVLKASMNACKTSFNQLEKSLRLFKFYLAQAKKIYSDYN